MGFAAMAAAGLRSDIGHPDAPGAVASLVEGCRGFEKTQVWFSVFDKQRLPAPGDRLFVLRAVDDGRLSVDELEPHHTRYYWSDIGELTRHSLRQEHPWTLPNFGEKIADVFDECRDGFASSDWVMTEPSHDMKGWTPLWKWVKLELPFSWAEGMDIWLAATYAPAPELRQLVIHAADGDVVVTIQKVDWAATFNVSDIDEWAPKDELPRPDFWQNGISDAHRALSWTEN
jgi:hypothetical protein